MTERTQDELDEQLTAALEAVPYVAIADDFAARVMSRVPARRVWAKNLPARASIGRRVAMIAAALLVIAMIAFATPSRDANPLSRTLVEWTFAGEFVALTLWLSLRPGEQR